MRVLTRDITRHDAIIFPVAHIFNSSAIYLKRKELFDGSYVVTNLSWSSVKYPGALLSKQ